MGLLLTLAYVLIVGRGEALAVLCQEVLDAISG
jgi:hypothetical protein